MGRSSSVKSVSSSSIASSSVSERIQVFTRLRPLQNREQAEEGQYAKKKRVESCPGGEIRLGGSVVYKFDEAFDENDSQVDVFERSALPLVDSVCEGYNAAVIAYGQTGSGKTYSMLGGVDIWKLAEDSVREGTVGAFDLPLKIFSKSTHRGVTPRALKRIFDYIENEAPTKSLDVSCSCSYVEVYNEQVYDLLCPVNNAKRTLNERGLEIYEDKYNGVHVRNLTSVKVKTLRDVLKLLWQGAVNRAVDATDMNEYSSRSHTVFQVTLEQKTVQGIGYKSKLNLVDLAGSEKWRTHQLATFSSERISEMTRINNSLSNLGNCVRALLEQKPHVPYRNSKLTRLLQDSLGGNSKTSFLVTLSPFIGCLEETHSSLQFADRAKRVVLQVSVNEDLDEPARFVRQLMNRVKYLEAEIECLKKDPHQEEVTSPSIGVLKHDVESAARKLKRWNETQPKNLVKMDDDKTLKLYEKWLYSNLVNKTTGESNKTPVLSKENRLAMAEWAILMQAQKLQSLNKPL